MGQTRDAWLARTDAKSLCEICYRKFHGAPRARPKQRCAVCAKAAKLTGNRCAKCIKAGHEAPSLFDKEEA